MKVKLRHQFASSGIQYQYYEIEKWKIILQGKQHGGEKLMNIIYLNKIILINLNSFNSFHQNKDLVDLLITFRPFSRPKIGCFFLNFSCQVHIVQYPHTFGTHVRRTLQKFQVKSLKNTILRGIYRLNAKIQIYYMVQLYIYQILDIILDLEIENQILVKLDVHFNTTYIVF